MINIVLLKFMFLVKAEIIQVQQKKLKVMPKKVKMVLFIKFYYLIKMKLFYLKMKMIKILLLYIIMMEEFLK